MQEAVNCLHKFIVLIYCKSYSDVTTNTDNSIGRVSQCCLHILRSSDVCPGLMYEYMSARVSAGIMGK